MDLVPLWVEATAYDDHCAICQTTGHTYDGTRTEHRPYGIAGSLHFRIGQPIWIAAGQGVLDRVRAFDRQFICDDRGQGVTREAREAGIPRIDIRMKDHASAQAFGRRRILVYVERR